MSVRPPALARIGVVAALLAALAGCSDSPDETAKSAPGNAQAPAASTATSTTSTPTGTTTATPSGAPTGEPAGGPALVPGRDISSDGARWRVEVIEARRQGAFVTVKTRVTLLAPKPGEDDAWGYQVWADAGLTRAEKFELLDLVNKKRHLVARDSEDRCVCTSDVNGIQLFEGESTVLEATFAAPPPDVTKVQVVAPAPMGTFSDVPIS